MTPIPIHPEGPRYARSLIFVPGLWTAASSMRSLASFLAHRGWAGMIADAGGTGGVAGRAEDIARFARTLDSPPVVVGHDAGGLVALAAGHLAPLGGVVWLAPIGPKPRQLTRLLGPWRVANAMLRGRDLPTPRGPAGAALFGDQGPTGLAAREAVALVRDVIRGGVPPPPLPSVSVLLVAAAVDPLSSEAVVPGAEVLQVAVPSRWLLGASAWRVTAGAVHRWLVQRLGAENLELYEEAMADREASDEE